MCPLPPEPPAYLPSHPNPSGLSQSTDFPFKAVHCKMWCLIFGFLLLCRSLVMSNSVTPRAAARQTSLSFTISQSLLRLMSIESVMPSNRLFLLHLSFNLTSEKLRKTISSDFYIREILSSKYFSIMSFHKKPTLILK